MHVDIDIIINTINHNMYIIIVYLGGVSFKLIQCMSDGLEDNSGDSWQHGVQHGGVVFVVGLLAIDSSGVQLHVLEVKHDSNHHIHERQYRDKTQQLSYWNTFIRSSR